MATIEKIKLTSKEKELYDNWLTEAMQSIIRTYRYNYLDEDVVNKLTNSAFAIADDMLDKYRKRIEVQEKFEEWPS